MFKNKTGASNSLFTFYPFIAQYQSFATLSSFQQYTPSRQKTKCALLKLVLVLVSHFRATKRRRRKQLFLPSLRSHKLLVLVMLNRTRYLHQVIWPSPRRKRVMHLHQRKLAQRKLAQRNTRGSTMYVIRFRFVSFGSMYDSFQSINRISR